MASGESGEKQQGAGVLPNGMVEWIETATSSQVIKVEAAVGAGVSREGAYVTLDVNGEVKEAYLAFDVRRADDPSRAEWCRREAAALRLAEKMDCELRGFLPAGQNKGRFLPIDYMLKPA